MLPDSPPRFSDNDLARLESLLAQEVVRDRALPPDAMQGFFCALAIGPDGPHGTVDAVASALGDDDGVPPHRAELVELVTRFQGETIRALDERSLSPLLYELRRGRLDYRTWCRGFLEGVERADADWYASADPDDVAELLFPIRVIADDLTDEERHAHRPQQWRRMLLEGERALPDTLNRIRDFWAIVRSPPQTLRREGAKVGRNDACPCGSGRKFKHCHGR